MQNISPNVKKVTIIGLVLAGVVLLPLLILINQTSGPEIKLNNVSSIPGNVEHSPVAVTDNFVIFSNGRSIVKYSPSTKKSEKLFSLTSMPLITSMALSPDQKKVALKMADDAGTNPELQAIVGPAEQDGFPNIWVVNTESGGATAIGKSSIDAHWGFDNNLYYASGPNIFVRNLGKIVNEPYFQHGSEIKNFRLDSSGEVTYLDSTGLLAKSSKDTKKRSVIAENINGVVFGKSDCYFIQKGEDQTESTESELLGCGGGHKKLPELISSGIFTTDGKYFLYLYREKGEQLYSKYVDLSLKKTGNFTLDEKFTQSDEEYVSANTLNSLTMRSGEKFYSNQLNTQYKKIEENKTLRAGDITIDITNDDQTMVASKNAAFTSQDRTNIDTTLSQNGFDPNLFTIQFIVTGNDDYRWD